MRGREEGGGRSFHRSSTAPLFHHHVHSKLTQLPPPTPSTHTHTNTHRSSPASAAVMAIAAGFIICKKDVRCGKRNGHPGRCKTTGSAAARSGAAAAAALALHSSSAKAVAKAAKKAKAEKAKKAEAKARARKLKMMKASRSPGFVKCIRTKVCPKANGHMGRCKLSGPLVVNSAGDDDDVMSEDEDEEEDSEDEEEDDEDESDDDEEDEDDDEEEESEDEEEESPSKNKEKEEEEEGKQRQQQETVVKRCTRHPNCPKAAGHRGACKTRAPPAPLPSGASVASLKAMALASEEAEATAQRTAEVVAEAIWLWHPRVDSVGGGVEGHPVPPSAVQQASKRLSSLKLGKRKRTTRSKVGLDFHVCSCLDPWRSALDNY